MLEKINAPSIRTAAAADLYDWDELVQEDRVHRLIYTDPAIFEAEMTQYLGRGLGLSRPRQPDPEQQRLTSPTKLGLRPIILLRDSNGKIRALFNRCTHRGTTLCRLGARQCLSVPSARITAGASSIPASCAPCRGRTAMPATSRTRSSMSRRCRASTAIAASSSARSTSTRRRSSTISAASRGPIDEWLDRNPGGKVVVCEANRLKYKGNWKLAYDNSGDGYHVVFSHRSLLEMENRLADEANKGMSYYKGSPDSKAMYMHYIGNGHHFKDKRPNIEKRSGGLWAVEGPAPGSEHYEAEFRRRFGAKADDILDLAGSEPVNINVFPNLSLLGNHIQVFEPISVDETNVTWYGTSVVDADGTLGDALDEINALRMRTQEQFPNFGEVDDLANFEEIQRGLACLEDEWVYMHRGLGIPGRIKTDAKGEVTAPATDEVFMREYIHEWKRLMKASPNLVVQREP